MGSDRSDIEKQIELGKTLVGLQRQIEQLKKQRGKMSETISRYKAKYGALSE